jgi:hypothetical protein
MQTFSLYATFSVANYPSLTPVDPHCLEVDRKIAVGVVFDDGICVLKYLRFIRQPHVFDSITDLKKVIGHGGRSAIVWDNPALPLWFAIPAHSGL